MMGHGRHCYCVICSTGKSLGILEVCENTSCDHPSHGSRATPMAMTRPKTKVKKVVRKTVRKKSKNRS
jgi:hypothetical protein